SPYNYLARLAAHFYMEEAASNAEQAAQTIDADITNPRNGWLIAPVYNQVIDLIGHSRGGAVNARVSQLLTQHGYDVTQYTALAGYSTDWPYPSGILGDISITGTATADRKVNYEVQEGLGQIVAQWLLANPVGLAGIAEAELALIVGAAT